MRRKTPVAPDHDMVSFGLGSYLGELVGLDEEEKNVIIKTDNGEKIFPRIAVASLKTHYDFADN